MALLLKRLIKGYFWLFNDIADPRANEYVLLSSTLVPVGISAFYLYFIFQMGPALMRNRKPFQMKTFLVLYNLSQIIFNVTLLVLGCQELNKMNLDCNPVDYTESAQGRKFITLSYYFYLLKVYDLVDTIIIVLKKNSRQISFLHVYHHCGMVVGSFIGAKFVGGGETFWTGFFNVTVHGVMYLYYLLATLDSKWKKNMSIKKLLTQMQLAQFVANIFFYGRLFFRPNCNFPRLIPILYVPQNLFMLALFGDFYIKTYILAKSK